MNGFLRLVLLLSDTVASRREVRQLAPTEFAVHVHEAARRYEKSFFFWVSDIIIF